MVTPQTTVAQTPSRIPPGQLAFADADGCTAWLRSLPVTNISRYYEEIIDQLRRVSEADFAPRERGRIAELMREPVNFLHTELARRYAGKPQPSAAREQEAADQAATQRPSRERQPPAAPPAAARARRPTCPPPVLAEPATERATAADPIRRSPDSPMESRSRRARGPRHRTSTAAAANGQRPRGGARHPAARLRARPAGAAGERAR